MLDEEFLQEIEEAEKDLDKARKWSRQSIYISLIREARLLFHLVVAVLMRSASTF